MYKVTMYLRGVLHTFFAKTLRGGMCRATKLANQCDEMVPEVEIYKGDKEVAFRRHILDPWTVAKDASN